MTNIDYLMEHASKFPVLSREEERKTIKAAQAGDRRARDKIINSNIRFVVKRAHAHSGYININITLEDMTQEGMIGLSRALDKFDLDKNCKFITYAVWWVNASIRSYILGNHSVFKMGTTSSERVLFFRMSMINNIIHNIDPIDRERMIERMSSQVNVSTKAIKKFIKK